MDMLIIDLREVLVVTMCLVVVVYTHYVEQYFID